ncbi:MAG TPA: glycosyltransferase family 4 protein [Solirubrobacterales bacterium]
MKVQLLDPSAFTPPYDHALSAALARAGADVELVTSRFLYGPVPREDGYRVTEAFYRRTAARGLEARGRRALKLAEHVPDMIRARSLTAAADVVHWQWVTVPGLDAALLPPSRPRAYTVHYPLPSSRAGIARERALLRRMDAVFIHTESGARTLRERIGLDPGRVHVIPHGAFDYLTRLREEPLPPELADVEGPVVLCFGLIRPYKGVDVLLEAFRGLEGAELWIVGMPRMPLAPLQELAARCRVKVRFVPRFVTDPEIPSFFRRADVVVLPHREIEQSGVLYTALAFGKPIVASAVGGFADVGEAGGAALVPAGDAGALRTELDRLIGDAPARRALGEAAAGLAASAYSWDSIAERTLAIYRDLLA